MSRYQIFPWIVGVFLLVSATLKAIHPTSLVPVLSFLGMSEIFIPFAVSLLVSVELILGIWLILLQSQLVVQLTTGMLLFFTLILGILLLAHDGPSCGCLGVVRLFKSNQSEALFGIGRNLLLIGMLIVHTQPKDSHQQIDSVLA